MPLVAVRMGKNPDTVGSRWDGPCLVTEGSMYAGEGHRHSITNYIINYAITTVRSSLKKTEGLSGGSR